MREVTIVDDTKTPAYIATSIEMRDGGEEAVEHRASDDGPEYDIEEAAPEARKPDAGTANAGYRARRLKL